MLNEHSGIKNTKAFSDVVNKLRTFCLGRGFYEVNTQDRLSILAACEDPETLATYEYAGQLWPLPQTGQMWLEYELLSRPDIPGVFCVNTSYRNEQDPVPGRHRLIFPMFEFELRGDIETLVQFETELLEHLGFGNRETYHYKKYDQLKAHYKTSELTHEHENEMQNDFGSVVFCQEFPSYTSPFWNIKKKDENYAFKIDVILGGNETIGSAERSVSIREMTKEFYTMGGGEYAEKLFELFGRDRVETELSEFLSLNFSPRCGGGIGLTRLMDALGN